MIKNYFSLVKFSHTVFALPFAMIGFFLAVHTNQNLVFRWQTLVYVVLCMVFARNAAMGFNRYLDRNIDKKNPRTAQREVPAGIISPRNALFFVFLNAFLFILTTFFMNRLVFCLSPVALAVILGYSYTKRFTSFCHFVLGLGLSLAPIGAYLAVNGYFALVPVLFSFTVLFWVSGFDIIYALQDVEFDTGENLNSIPVKMGKKQALLLSSFLHLFASLLVIVVGVLSDFGVWYWVGVLAFVSLLIYQHTLVKPNDLSRVNAAFFTTNGIASVVFAFCTILSFYF